MDLSGYQAISMNGISMKKITIGDVLVWERLLPGAYQQVEYIQSDGSQYIDTGVLASDHPNGIKYTFRGQVTGYANASGNNYLFGALNSGKRSGNINLYKGRNAIYVMIGGTGEQAWVSPIWPSVGADFELVMTAVSSDIDGVVATCNGTSFTRVGSTTVANCDMPNANIYFLWCSGVGSTSKPFTGKTYAFSMDRPDGTPIRNFVPCYRKADNVIGLYDTVGGVFYTNKGTGSFTKGADV